MLINFPILEVIIYNSDFRFFQKISDWIGLHMKVFETQNFQIFPQISKFPIIKLSCMYAVCISIYIESIV